MKILWLYERFKCGGGQYHRSKQLAASLEQRHRVHYAYAILTDKEFQDVKADDPAKPELVSADEFLRGTFDCVIVDGAMSANPSVPRIPVSLLADYHSRGGIVAFLSDMHTETDFVRNRGLSDEKLRTYLGSCFHGNGGPFREPEGGYVKGYQRGDSSLRIEVDDDYLRMLPDCVRQHIYPGVKCIETEQPFHLGPFADWLCIGDRSTQMFTTFDEHSRCPRPFVFANLSLVGQGVTSVVTGFIGRDSVVGRGNNDNQNLLLNLVAHLDRHQVSVGYWRRGPLLFISYSHTDAAVARDLATHLESRGAEVWLDEKSTNTGTSISAECEKGIRKSDYFVFLVSRKALESDWVKWELETALRFGADEGRKDWILPGVIDVDSSTRNSALPALRDHKYSDLNLGKQRFMEAIAKAAKL